MLGLTECPFFFFLNFVFFLMWQHLMKIVLSADEFLIVTHLNNAVEAHPKVTFGSYPYVSNLDFKTVSRAGIRVVIILPYFVFVFVFISCYDLDTFYSTGVTVLLRILFTKKIPVILLTEIKNVFGVFSMALRRSRHNFFILLVLFFHAGIKRS